MGTNIHQSNESDNELNYKENVQIKKPKKYCVIMYNDDFTPMDFVVLILMDIFHKEEREAVDLMLQIHEGTKAVAGVYSYDIAKTKAELSVKRARAAGYPFLVTVEES